MSTPIEIVTSYLRAFSRNDPDALAAHVSEGFRNNHNSELGSGCVGRDEYRRRLPAFLADFQDRAYTIDDIVSQARESCTDVVVRYRFQATYKDARFRHPGCHVVQRRDQLITKRIDTWDSCRSSIRPSRATETTTTLIFHEAIEGRRGSSVGEQQRVGMELRPRKPEGS